MRQSFIVISRVILLLLVLVVLTGGGFLIWLKTGTRSITGLSELVIAQLQPSNLPLEVRLEGVRLGWDDVLEPANLTFERAEIVSAVTDVRLPIEKGRLTLDLWALLIGEVALDSVHFEGIEAEIVHSVKRWAIYNGSDELIYQQEISLPKNPAERWSMPPANTFSFADMNLSVRFDHPHGGEYKILDGIIRISKTDAERVKILSSGLVRRKNRSGVLQFGGHYNFQQQSGQFLLKTAAIHPELLCGLPLDCSAYPQANLIVGGQLTAEFQKAGFTRAQWQIDGLSGTVSFPQWLPAPLNVQSFSLNGAYDPLQDQWVITQFDLKSQEEERFSAKGVLAMKPDGLLVDAEMVATNMNVARLEQYWPEALLPLSRRWVIEHIRGGTIKKVKASLNHQPAMPWRPLPADALTAEIQLSDSTLHLPGDLPVARKVNAQIAFTGGRMEAQIHEAELDASTQIEQARITLTDLHDEALPMELAIDFLSMPGDIHRIVSALNMRRQLRELVDISKATGAVKGSLSAAFNADSSQIEAGAHVSSAREPGYELSARLSNIDGLRLPSGLMLNKANGQMNIAEDRASCSLTAQYRGSPLSLHYEDEADQPARIKLTGNVDASHLRPLLPDITSYVSGPLQIDTKLTGWPDPSRIQADIDLSAAEVYIGPLAMAKPRQRPAHLSLSRSGTGSIRWKFKTDEWRASGTVTPNRGFDMINGFMLQELRHPRQDFALDYKAQPGESMRVKLSGRRLDLGGWLQQKGQEKGGFSLQAIPAVEATIDLKRLVLGEGREIRELTGHLHCGIRRCHAADIRAELAQGEALNFSIFSGGVARRAVMQAADWGGWLRVLDINERVYGGAFEFKGAFQDDAQAASLDGRAVITDFVIRDGPILGQLLSTGSLTGLIDTLRGEGIQFNKLASNVRLARDVLTIEEAALSGPSLGILFEGEFNLQTEMLHFQGNLAPAYAINSFVGKIPLIGKMLAGGEGESIFAINFAIKGGFEDPAVTVNPLSALTPGFTRKFFDIFKGELDTGNIAEPIPTPIPEPVIPQDGQSEKAGDQVAPDKQPKAEGQPLPESLSDELEWQVINP